MIKKFGSDQDVYTEFYKNSHTLGRYTAYIRGKRCRTLDGFLKEYSAAFQFPYYFGENWNAWDECATDLEWLCFESIAIIIDDYDMLFCDEVDSNVLIDALDVDIARLEDYWTNEQSIDFLVIAFSCSDGR